MSTRMLAALTVLVFALVAVPRSLAEPPATDWIRGTLDELQIRLRGEVFYPDGQPANDIVVENEMSVVSLSTAPEPVVNGNRFELWIPVNDRPYFVTSLRVASKDGAFVQYKHLGMSELRQAAIDGIRLTLQQPTRVMNVKVTDQGQPIANAIVKADLGYSTEIRERTDTNGVARFHLLPAQTPSSLTAWTDDFRIGGFGFSRQSSDPKADQHGVQLSRCRDLKLRFIDEDGRPVPDITFTLYVASMPHYIYIGTNEHSQLTTDINGEVVYRWFPDWDQHYFYPELQTRNWVPVGKPEMVDGVAVTKLKKGVIRKRVMGRTEIQGESGNRGFFVTLRSFQGEQEGHSDVLYAFSDTNGEFAIDVLPDATYCIWALDSNWVSEIKHSIPYQSATNTVTSPTVAVDQGQRVEVIVTSGESKKPYPDLSVSFFREHQYSWLENGETRYGTSGPQWFATTDDNGVAKTVSLPGKLKASVYTPLWRTESEVEVKAGDDRTVVRLHRELDQKRTVTGKLVLGDGCDSSLLNATLKMACIDGNYNDQQELKVQQDGSFTFETLGSQIGLFAITQDEKAAGAIVAKGFETPIVLQMRPTIDYQGQLLGDSDQPLVEQSVWAIVQIEGPVDYNRQSSFSTTFEVMRPETKTDSQGKYKLLGLPNDVKISIRTKSQDQPTSTRFVDEAYLQAGENRPIAVSHLGTRSGSTTTPLAKKYESMLRDCSLSGFHMMVIASARDESTREFVGKNLVNYKPNEANASYMQLVVAGDRATLPQADVAFLDERNYPLPSGKRIFACALDSHGNELGRFELDSSEEDAADQLSKFIQSHRPSQVDAEEKWSKAFAEAKKSKRVVWARVSQRFCGPCFMLARWLDDHRELLSKDYVLLKIDDVRDEHGVEVAERLTRGGRHGVPFHVIFDADQQVIVDSAGPLGNIGHPSGFEGKKHVRKMLLQSRQRLTDAEIDQIVNSLPD